MEKVLTKMVDHPIATSILISSILGGIAKIIVATKKLCS